MILNQFNKTFLKISTIYYRTGPKQSFSTETQKPNQQTETENNEQHLNKASQGQIQKSTNILDVDAQVKIVDIYHIKSKKMGPANINKVIDKSRINHPNVKLSNFNVKDFNKDHFATNKLVPISPKLGPFEV